MLIDRILYTFCPNIYYEGFYLMKSMLQEGASVIKAIDKAWNDCGRPREFTIKVLEQEDKGFWGTVKSPAVISITFDPKKQPQPIREKNIEKVSEKKIETKKEKVNIPKKRTKNQNASGLIDSFFGKNKKEKVSKKQEDGIPQKESRRREYSIGWNKQLINDAIGWLKEMFETMKIKTNFKFKFDQKLLNIYLDRRILKDAEEEKLFFISISHLLMQFLKRKHKKKLKNYYLIINSQTVGTNGAKK